MNIQRREFIRAGGMLAIVGAGGRAVAAEGAAEEKGTVPAAEGAAPAKLIVSPPVLQNAAETSIGVGFAVSAMANGYVKISSSPDMKDARLVKCGGYRVTGMDDKFILVRLTGLDPATTYYYTIGADRIDYQHGYSMKIVGSEEDPRVYSFRTLGAAALSSFCVVNDTHCRPEAFGPAVDKIAELAPSCVVWDGDACNSHETFESLLPVFYTPEIARVDYAACQPYLFVPGNHDYRGLAARHLERAMMFREMEERPPRFWDLGRNFAVRCGDIALIGLDTGEDKLDTRPSQAGLFNFAPYRLAQRDWLAEVLERPDVKSAPFVVAFCHIPLHDDNPHAHPGDVEGNGDGKYWHDFALWQRTCRNLWGPLFAKHGVQAVICAHQHRYRYDAPTEDRPWAHFVGGGPTFGPQKKADGTVTEDPSRFPTVIEGKVEDGKLRITAHDLYHRTIAGSYLFPPRTHP